MKGWLDYEDVYEGGGARVAGTVKVLRGVRSEKLDNTRDILVYLPPSYPDSNRTYPTLYMHDGQNLFDEATSFAGEWRVDDALEQLAGEGIEAIVVGVPNTGANRLAEYSPFRDARFGGGRAGEYLDFIVDTVRPLVDEAFRTTGEREGTATIGSSMGESTSANNCAQAAAICAMSRPTALTRARTAAGEAPLPARLNSPAAKSATWASRLTAAHEYDGTPSARIASSSRFPRVAPP